MVSKVMYHFVHEQWVTIHIMRIFSRCTQKFSEKVHLLAIDRGVRRVYAYIMRKRDEENTVKHFIYLIRSENVTKI